MAYGQLIDLNLARGQGRDLAAVARGRFASARRRAGLTPAEFASRIADCLGWSITGEAVEAWETTGVPPGDVLLAAESVGGHVIAAPHPEPVRLVHDVTALQEALSEVVDSAHEVLAVTGSRSREPDYLTHIERAIGSRPGLTHYRVLYGPPRHGAMKNHLLRLVDMQLAEDVLRVGIVTDLARDMERFICASESQAVVILPSLTSIMNFDSGLHVSDPAVAGRWVAHVRQAWLGAIPLTTRDQVEALEIVR